jgi:FkbM family methyltransferase
MEFPDKRKMTLPSHTRSEHNNNATELLGTQEESTWGNPSYSSYINNSIQRVIRTISPKLYWKRKVRHLVRSMHEYELRIVPLLCDPRKVSIDVGASNGVYALRMCEVSGRVIAFEPRPAQAAEIREMVSATRLPIEVEAVALSDRAGLARLRILTKDLGRSTIESANVLEDPDGSPRVEIRVPKLRLDDYELHNVGIIKIDVEGHELAVLQGSEQTIRASLPTLLVEIEDRHRANTISDISAFLAELGYEGFFLLDGELLSFAQFDKKVHQDPANIGGWKDNWARRGIYVNNFFFVPIGSGNILRKAAMSMK